MTKEEAIENLVDAFTKAALDSANVGGVAGAALIASQAAMLKFGIRQIIHSRDRDEPAHRVGPNIKK